MVADFCRWVIRRMPATIPTASSAAAAFTQPAAMTGFWTSVPEAFRGSGPPLSTTTVYGRLRVGPRRNRSRGRRATWDVPSWPGRSCIDAGLTVAVSASSGSSTRIDNPAATLPAFTRRTRDRGSHWTRRSGGRPWRRAR